MANDQQQQVSTTTTVIISADELETHYKEEDAFFESLRSYFSISSSASIPSEVTQGSFGHTSWGFFMGEDANSTLRGTISYLTKESTDMKIQILDSLLTAVDAIDKAGAPIQSRLADLQKTFRTLVTASTEEKPDLLITAGELIKQIQEPSTIINSSYSALDTLYKKKEDDSAANDTTWTTRQTNNKRSMNLDIVEGTMRPTCNSLRDRYRSPEKWGPIPLGEEHYASDWTEFNNKRNYVRAAYFAVNYVSEVDKRRKALVKTIGAQREWHSKIAKRVNEFSDTLAIASGEATANGEDRRARAVSTVQTVMNQWSEIQTFIPKTRSKCQTLLGYFNRFAFFVDPYVEPRFRNKWCLGAAYGGRVVTSAVTIGVGSDDKDIVAAINSNDNKFEHPFSLMFYNCTVSATFVCAPGTGQHTIRDGQVSRSQDSTSLCKVNHGKEIYNPDSSKEAVSIISVVWGKNLIESHDVFVKLAESAIKAKAGSSTGMKWENATFGTDAGVNSNACGAVYFIRTKDASTLDNVRVIAGRQGEDMSWPDLK